MASVRFGPPPLLMIRLLFVWIPAAICIVHGEITPDPSQTGNGTSTSMSALRPKSYGEVTSTETAHVYVGFNTRGRGHQQASRCGQSAQAPCESLAQAMDEWLVLDDTTESGRTQIVIHLIGDPADSCSVPVGSALVKFPSSGNISLVIKSYPFSPCPRAKINITGPLAIPNCAFLLGSSAVLFKGVDFHVGVPEEARVRRQDPQNRMLFCGRSEVDVQILDCRFYIGHRTSVLYVSSKQDAWSSISISDSYFTTDAARTSRWTFAHHFLYDMCAVAIFEIQVKEYSLSVVNSKFSDMFIRPYCRVIHAADNFMFRLSGTGDVQFVGCTFLNNTYWEAAISSLFSGTDHPISVDVANCSFAHNFYWSASISFQVTLNRSQSVPNSIRFKNLELTERTPFLVSSIIRVGFKTRNPAPSNGLGLQNMTATTVDMKNCTFRRVSKYMSTEAATILLSADHGSSLTRVVISDCNFFRRPAEHYLRATNISHVHFVGRNFFGRSGEIPISIAGMKSNATVSGRAVTHHRRFLMDMAPEGSVFVTHLRDIELRDPQTGEPRPGVNMTYSVTISRSEPVSYRCAGKTGLGGVCDAIDTRTLKFSSIIPKSDPVSNSSSRPLDMPSPAMRLVDPIYDSCINDDYCLFVYDDGPMFLVTNQIDAFLPLLEAPLSWIIFRSTSTACSKRVKSNHVHVNINCSRTAIMSEMNRKRLNLAVSWGSIYLAHLYFFKERWFDAKFSNVELGPYLQLTPWREIKGRSWNTTITHMDPFSHRRYDVALYNSQITLHPAPGEEISLQLDVLDEVLNSRTGTFSMSAECPKDNCRLLRYSGGAKGLKVVDKIMFHSSTPVEGFALAGRPGASGSLKIALKPEIGQTREFISEASAVLNVPFQLRLCHPGYVWPERTGINDMENRTSTPSALPWASLVCQCNPSPGVLPCLDGRRLRVRAGYWAGEVGKTVSAVAGNDSQEDLFMQARRANFSQDEFAVARCLNGLCNDYDWELGLDPDCRRNATGPLCGKCVSGTQLKLAVAGCVECKKELFRIPLAAYIPVVIVMTSLLLAVMLFFDMGMSPVLDTWLFFTQACWYIFPEGDTFVFSSLYTVLTFGLGHLCLREELNRLQASTLLLLQPFVFLVLFVLLRLARSNRHTAARLQRLLTHLSLNRVMWLVLIYSYFMLAFTSINILSCVKLNQRYVLAMDGSIGCFQEQHILYVVVAMVIIGVIIIPTPLVLVLPQAYRVLSLRLFIDEAYRLYANEYRRWAAINLLRRIVLAVVYSQIGDLQLRIVVTTALLFVMLITHVLVKPLHEGSFMHLSYNTWESCSLILLTVIATLHIITEGDYNLRGVDQAAFTLYLAPTVTIALAVLYNQLFSKSGGYGRLQNVSLYMWWQKRQRAQDPDDCRCHPLNEQALDAMLENAREPLIVHEMRQRGGV